MDRIDKSTAETIYVSSLTYNGSVNNKGELK